jgi:hypothetical protein
MASEPRRNGGDLGNVPDGPQLTDEIKRICLGDELRIAAAYWGRVLSKTWACEIVQRKLFVRLEQGLRIRRSLLSSETF